MLHPHETLHTIEEIIQLLPELGCKLVSTSINKFHNIKDPKSLMDEEKNMLEVSKKRL